MANRLLRTKSLGQLMNESSDSKNALKRTLTATNLTTLGIGAISGAGIFVLTGDEKNVENSDYVAKDILDAANWIIKNENSD